MSSTKKYEYRENKNYNRDTEGLKQRRLKNESRWKFNPNDSYDESNEEELDDFNDFEEHDDQR
jgi:hypothetical protein